jgi:hypothetical protein
MKTKPEFLQETSTEALVKAMVREIESGLERAVLDGKEFVVHIDHAGREITYDLRGIKNARKEGQTHLVWEDLDGNTIKVNLRRLDEK